MKPVIKESRIAEEAVADDEFMTIATHTPAGFQSDPPGTARADEHGGIQL